MLVLTVASDSFSKISEAGQIKMVHCTAMLPTPAACSGLSRVNDVHDSDSISLSKLGANLLSSKEPAKSTNAKTHNFTYFAFGQQKPQMFISGQQLPKHTIYEGHSKSNGRYNIIDYKKIRIDCRKHNKRITEAICQLV